MALPSAPTILAYHVPPWFHAVAMPPVDDPTLRPITIYSDADRLRDRFPVADVVPVTSLYSKILCKESFTKTRFL